MLKWLAHTWNQRTRRTFYQLLSGTGFALCLSAMKPRFHVVKDVRRTVDKACTVAQEDASEVIGLEKFLNMLDMSELAISVLKNECEKFESRSIWSSLI
ncbi:O-fucosyltransferase [Trichinella pseudospiralis]